MTTQETLVEQQKKANKIIRFRTLFATGAGLVPVPIVDAIGIMSVQIWMIKDLAKLYNITFKKHIVKSLISSLVGNVGTFGVVKFIPGLGSLIGAGTVALTGAAATYALGKVFTMHFDQGGTLLNFDPVKSREHFRQLFEEGKTVVPAMQAQTAGLQVATQTAMPVQAAAIPVKKRGGLRRLGLLLLLLLVAVGGFWIYRSGYFSKKAGGIEASAQLSTAAVGEEKDGTAAQKGEGEAPADSTAVDSTAAGKADTAAAQQPKAEAPTAPPDAAALGFAAGSSEAQMADYLSKPNSKFPKTFPLSAIQFEEGASELSPEAQAQVANLVKLLQSYPNAKVKLYGHTDQNGGQAANRQAGAKRAKAIENALKQAGIPGRLLSTSYMEKKAEPQGKRGAEVEIAQR